MRYTDGYSIETDEGLAYIRPLDLLLKNAIAIVPREQWQECPKCKLKCPLMFGTADTYHCAFCQIEKENASTQS